MARYADSNYSGIQKAAILLIALGPEKSSQIFKHLKEEEIEEQKFEQPEIEVPQEVLATVQVTQIAIVDAEEVKNEIMDQEAQQEDNTARGVVNQEGSDDADKFQAMAEVVVVKEPEPEPVKEEEIFVLTINSHNKFFDFLWKFFTDCFCTDFFADHINKRI